MRKNIPLHPFLIGLYPILYFFSKNLSHFPPKVTFIPSLVIIGFVIIVLFITGFIFRSISKASVYTTFLLVILFLPYQIVPKLVEDIGLLNTYIFCVVMAIVGLVYLLKTRHSFVSINKVLNLMALVLVAIPLFTIGRHFWIVNSSVTFKKSKNIAMNSEGVRPNVYYIILDAYSRDDYLRKVLNYDNSSFIKSLEDRGFNVRRKSYSNYPDTMTSLSSSLNLNYLDSMADNITPSTYQAHCCKFISNNMLFDIFKSAGYKIKAIDSGCLPTQLVRDNVDIFVTEGRGLFDNAEFVDNCFGKTVFYKYYSACLQKKNVSSDAWREAVLKHAGTLEYAFKALKSVPEANIKTPHFVFFHVLCPHDPFPFDESGNINPLKGDLHLDWSKDEKGKWKTTPTEKWGYCYSLQLKPLNSRVLDAVDSILAFSKTPPIIIIQGDHGCRWWPKESKTEIQRVGRYGILNAIHIPSNMKVDIPEDISPVNTFRIITNNLFDKNFEILPYKVYSTSFTDITSEVEAIGADWEV